MPSRFEDQNHNKTKDDQQQQEDAFPPSGILLVPCGYIQLLYSIRYLHTRLFDIILHAIEQCPLVNNKDAQVLE